MGVIKITSQKLLVFECGAVRLYEYGYEQYESQLLSVKEPQVAAVTEKKAGGKKSFTTPLKEKAKRERALKKAEEKIAILEQELSEIENELSLEENISDYVKLAQLEKKREQVEEELLVAMGEWETAAENCEEGD